MYVKNIRFWSRFSSFFLLCSHTIATFALEKSEDRLHLSIRTSSSAFGLHCHCIVKRQKRLFQVLIKKEEDYDYFELRSS